jgi:hypothetical protein
MHVRYRHLIRGKVIEPVPKHDGDGNHVPSRDVRELAGVEDGTGTLDEIADWLRSGRLSPHDLVDVGNGWISIEDCDSFAEVCAPILRREKLVRSSKLAAVLVSFVLLVVIGNVGAFAPLFMRRNLEVLRIAGIVALALVVLWQTLRRRSAAPRA